MAKYSVDIRDLVVLPEEVSDIDSVQSAIDQYLGLVKEIEFASTEVHGLDLLKMASLDPMTKGPHRGRFFVDSASIILTNLVILRGLEWMLRELPFDTYHVKYLMTSSHLRYIEAMNEEGPLICYAVYKSGDSADRNL